MADLAPITKPLVEDVLHRALQHVTIAGLSRNPPNGSSPLSVVNVPPRIDVPTTSTTTYRVDGIAKGVTFADHTWPPAGDGIRKTLPVSGLPIGFLDGTSTSDDVPGMIGSFEIRVPTPTSVGLKVTVVVGWSLGGASGGASVSPTGVSTTLSVVPPIVDWPSPVPPLTTTTQELRVNVRASVIARIGVGAEAKDEEVGIDLPFGPFPVVVTAVPLPSVLALCELDHFGGMVLLLVPHRSPLAGFVGKPESLTKTLDTIVSTLAAVPRLALTVAGLDHLVRVLKAAPRIVVAVGSPLDLKAIIMRTISQPPFPDVHEWADNLFESLIYISGSPGREIQLFNRPGHEPRGGGVFDGGAFKVSAGQNHVVAVESLTRELPRFHAERGGSAEMTHIPERGTFNGHLSSINWL